MRRRSLWVLVSAPLHAYHYVTFWKMVRTYRPFWSALRRYVVGGGAYPVDWTLVTPRGDVGVRLFHDADFLTLNEVFCREDYAAPSDVRVVVDIGSNIGISALYFLTRSDHVRCFLYEPDDRNVAKLRHNLDRFQGRFVLEQVAVGDRDGVVSFGREPSGRYGGVGAAFDDVIEVRCRDINSVLEDVLRQVERIDVLKVDTEGLEVTSIAAIRDDVLDRIDVIYFESEEHAPRLHPERFTQSRRALRERLSSRRAPPGLC